MKTAALLIFALAAAPPARAAEPLGRLFFTPEQRAVLDARRKARVPDRPAATIASPVTRIDGYVKRSRGPSTVWMNGESLGEGAGDAPRIEFRSGDGEVSISAGEGGRRIRLKPGESLDRGSGEVKDVIGDGDIEVHRGGGAP